MTIDFKKSISSPVAIDIGNHVTQDRIVSKTIQFAMFTTNENAVWASKQQLRKESYPFGIITVSVNRKLFRLQVGDCFKFSYSKYGISNMVCRILQIGEEELNSEQILIHAIEDIYSVANSITVYTDPTDLAVEPPSYILSPFVHQRVVEAPYVFSSDLKVIPVACRISDLDLGFDVYLSIDGGASYFIIDKASNLQPYGVLVGSYSSDTYPLDDSIGFTIDFLKDVSQVETVTWSEVFSALRNIAILGDEIISFQSITPVSGTQYKLEGIIRGRFGSKKVDHSEGEHFYVIGVNMALVQHSELIVGAERKFKLVPYNIKYSGDVSEATALDLTLEGNSKKPYTPTNFDANGGNFAARYSTDVVLIWSPRYRGKGAGIGNPGTVLADTDREGHFKIEVWVSSVKVRSVDGIDDVTWTYSEAMNISDNGTLANEITFKLLNYRVEDGITYESEYTTVICKKR